MNKGHQPANEDFQVDPSQTDSSRLSRDNQAETLNKQIVIIKPEAPKRRRNVATMCHPNSFVAETQTTSSSTSSTCDASTQTGPCDFNNSSPININSSNNTANSHSNSNSSSNSNEIQIISLI